MYPYRVALCRYKTTQTHTQGEKTCGLRRYNAVNRLRPAGHDNAGGASYDRFSSVFAHQSHRIHAGGMRRYGKPTESIS